MPYTVGNRAWVSWKRTMAGPYDDVYPNDGRTMFRRGWIMGYAQGWDEAMASVKGGEHERQQTSGQELATTEQ